MSTVKREKINLPEGTRDIVFDEALLYREIEQKLEQVYQAEDFKQIRTPAVEFADVFGSAEGALNLEDLYKMSDANGRLLALRGDNTMPICRVIATKMKTASFPQRIYYTQPTYRRNADYSGKRSETLQSGVELVGADGMKGDLICITTALRALEALGVPFKLELGHVGFYNALADGMGLSAEDKKLIRRFVSTKNTVLLGGLDNSRKIDTMKLDIIKKIPLLYGGQEILAQASALASGNQTALSALESLRALYNLLQDAGYGERILLDLGLVHPIDYYTGAVFCGYMEGAGEPVLQGGRYDRLLADFGCDLPAIGFGINICAAAEAVYRQDGYPARRKPDCILHFDSAQIASALQKQQELNKQGCKTVLSTFSSEAETRSYAAAHGIREVVIL